MPHPAEESDGGVGGSHTSSARMDDGARSDDGSDYQPAHSRTRRHQGHRARYYQEEDDDDDDDEGHPPPHYSNMEEENYPQDRLNPYPGREYGTDRRHTDHKSSSSPGDEDDEEKSKKAQKSKKAYSKARDVAVRETNGEWVILKNINRVSKFTNIPDQIKIKRVLKSGGGIIRNTRDGHFEVCYAKDKSTRENKWEGRQTKKRESFTGETTSQRDGVDGKRRQFSNPTAKSTVRLPLKLPLKLKAFDVSTLKPLSKPLTPASSFHNKIELICKATGDIPVCFPDARIAAQALGVSTGAIQNALSSKSHIALSFTSCDLQYSVTSEAYEYGTHDRDFHHVDETHQERLEQWASLERSVKLQQIRHKSTELLQQETASTQQSPKKPASKPVSAPCVFTKKRHDIKQFLEGTVIFPVVHNADLDTQVIAKSSKRVGSASSPRKSSTNTTKAESVNGLDVWAVCVACQNVRASIVLDPCHHQVLCRDCAKQYCPTFCPLCHTPIKQRLYPKHIMPIQPHVYSTFSRKAMT